MKPTAEELKPYRMFPERAKELTGVAAELYVFTRDQIEEFCASNAAAVKSEPAEGAETANMLLRFASRLNAEGLHSNIIRNFMEDDEYFRAGLKPQPTAEGAEEILPTDYDIAIEIVARFLANPHPKQRANYEREKKAFANGAIYMREAAQRLAAQQVAEEIKKLTPSNEQIHEAAKAWARGHSEAPDKDCPEWLIRDYEAGAYFVRQCYGCLNKTEVVEATKDCYPDTEADGYVFCGKCGKMKN